MSAEGAPVIATEESPGGEVVEGGGGGQEGGREEQQGRTSGPSHSEDGQTGGLSYEVAGRLRRSELLPPELKERLARLVEASSSAGGGGALEEAVRAVEEAVPELALAARRGGREPEHPGGDAFFAGEPGEISDAAAEKLAREQLARSGLLRGQRARFAD